MGQRSPWSSQGPRRAGEARLCEGSPADSQESAGSRLPLLYFRPAPLVPPLPRGAGWVRAPARPLPRPCLAQQPLAPAPRRPRRPRATITPRARAKGASARMQRP